MGGRPQSPVMVVMVRAARKAARALARDFGEVDALQVSRKGPSDFVTIADVKAEQILMAELSQARPHYGFVTEEKNVVEGADKSHRWFIDPIDGTTNFLHAIPHYAISIGLEREGTLAAGVIYNPSRDELFWAERGIGAFLNDKRLRVSARRDLKDCVLATGIPFHGRPGHEEFLADLPPLMGQVAGIRRFGSAALDLAYVAAGRFDGFWERGLKSWDMAAGIVLVREAGGEVTGIGSDDPLETGGILASNGLIHSALSGILTGLTGRKP